ncbi:MAG: hypothetical protein ACTHJ3_07690 [Pararhizobium sp.]
MKTVTVNRSFDAYPNGKKVRYAAGATLEVSDALGTNILAKGLAREAAPSAVKQEKTSEAE